MLFLSIFCHRFKYDMLKLVYKTISCTCGIIWKNKFLYADQDLFSLSLTHIHDITIVSCLISKENYCLNFIKHDYEIYYTFDLNLSEYLYHFSVYCSYYYWNLAHDIHDLLVWIIVFV